MKILAKMTGLKNNVYPCKPQFHCKEVGCNGCSLQGHVIMMTVSQCYKSTLSSKPKIKNSTCGFDDSPINGVTCVAILE